MLRVVREGKWHHIVEYNVCAMLEGDIDVWYVPLHDMSSSTTNPTRPIVFMDVNIGETPAVRVKMEVFSDIVPK